MKSIPTGMVFPEFKRNTRRPTDECAQQYRHTGSRRLAWSYLGTSGKRSSGAAQALKALVSCEIGTACFGQF